MMTAAMRCKLWLLWNCDLSGLSSDTRLLIFFLLQMMDLYGYYGLLDGCECLQHMSNVGGTLPSWLQYLIPAVECSEFLVHTGLCVPEFHSLLLDSMPTDRGVTPTGFLSK